MYPIPVLNVSYLYAKKRGGRTALIGGVGLRKQKFEPYSPKGYRRRFSLIYLIYLREGHHPLRG